MNQFGWRYCPDGVYDQVRNLLNALRGILSRNFVGMYLHGSLAMNCFNPHHSDIDLIVVTESGMTLSEKYAVAHLLLAVSRAPTPLEISFLSREQVNPWRAPTPFDLHFAESHRRQFAVDLEDGSWQSWNLATAVDPDLAAHVTVLRARGICIFGQPISALFPPIPERDYLESILMDLRWARERLDVDPAYYVLNACRVLGFLSDSHIYSKDEAGVWALDHLPAQVHGAVYRAMTAYRGTQPAQGLAGDLLLQFERFVNRGIAQGIGPGDALGDEI